MLYETAQRVRDGEGWPQDYDAAARWLERAGEAGVPEAHYQAALLLFDPDRGHHDPSKGKHSWAKPDARVM